MKVTNERGASDGDRLLDALAALANPHRLRILAALQTGGGIHVSELARLLGLSRPLLYLHLRKLAAAALVESRHELSADGKALAIYQVAPFDLSLTPASVAAAAATLSFPSEPPLSEPPRGAPR